MKRLYAKFMHYLRHKRGWPILDRGEAPCRWPFYRQRVALVRAYPWLYGVVWGDFR